MDLRNWQNVNGLLRVGEVGVFGLCSNDNLRGKSPNDRLAFWGSTADPNLSYPLPVGRRVAARAWLLDPLGHPSDSYYSEIVVGELRTLLNEFKPEIAVLEGLWMHRYIDLLRRHGCSIILDCHDAQAPQSLQLADLIDGDDLRVKLLGKILPERIKLIENKALHAVHQIWVCSSREAQLLERLYRPPVPIHVVPNGVDVSTYEGARSVKDSLSEPSAGSGKNIVFPAMFAYQPNHLAAVFLIEEVFPRITNIFSDCRLTLPGSWPTAPMLDAAKRNPGITVTGMVPDIRPYLASASVMVVPLFQGSGTRLKILEAFAAKVPVVSTAKGAEGLDVKNERHLLIAESPRDFAECLQRLWINPFMAKELIANGLDLVKRDYSWETANRWIRKAVNELRQPVLSGSTAPTEARNR